MLRNLDGVRHAVRLGILFLFRKIGNFIFSFHMISISGFRLDRTTAKCERGDSNPHGLLHWILSPARLPNSATSALTIQKDSNPRHRFLRAAKESPANCTRHRFLRAAKERHRQLHAAQISPRSPKEKPPPTARGRLPACFRAFAPTCPPAGSRSSARASPLLARKLAD